MLKQARNALTHAGLTNVVSNGKIQRRFDGKIMRGIRGGTFGPYTVSDMWRLANQDAMINIKAAMLDNGYEQIDEQNEKLILKFKHGKDVVTFILEDIRRGDNTTFWWVLSN